MSTYEPPTGSGWPYGAHRHQTPSEPSPFESPPSEPTPSDTTSDGPTPSRRRVWQWIAWPASVVGAFVAGLGIGLTFQLDEPTADNGSPANSRLEAAKEECADSSAHVTLGDGGSSLTIDGAGEESAGASWNEVVCVLDAVEAPDAVQSRFGSTRALDGMQETTWEEFYATWSYHPNSGVNLVIEVQDNP